MHPYITSFVNINRKWFIIALAVWAMSFIVNVWPVVFLVVFAALNALFLTYDRYVELPIDLELSTFFAIMMTLKFGLGWGIATAIITKVASMLYNRDFNRNSLFAIMGYVLAAIIAGGLASFKMPILMIGIIVTILVNIFSYFTYKFIVFLSDYELLLYGGTNLLFNIALFIGFSEPIFKLITLML